MAGKCEMKGFLNFLILNLVSNKCVSGDDIMNEIEKRKGCKPSPGTIYPVLKSLQEEGLIKECGKEGNSIKYTLTDSGIKELISTRKKFVVLFQELKSEFKK